MLQYYVLTSPKAHGHHFPEQTWFSSYLNPEFKPSHSMMVEDLPSMQETTPTPAAAATSTTKQSARWEFCQLAMLIAALFWHSLLL